MLTRHKCPICNNEAQFSPVLSDRSKCATCHGIVDNKDLVSLQHNVEIGDNDLIGEQPYG